MIGVTGCGRASPGVALHYVGAAGNVKRQFEQHLGVERDHPRDGKEQGDPSNRRQREPKLAGARLLILRELSGENRQKDDIVDPQHDLEDR